MNFETEHVCDASVNPCACGRRWDYLTRYSSGKVVYTSADVVQRYRAIYGKEDVPFEEAR